MNLSSVYLRGSGCPYMYTGPILPPVATPAPGTYLAGVSLYSLIVLVQLDCPCTAEPYVPAPPHCHSVLVSRSVNNLCLEKCGHHITCQVGHVHCLIAPPQDN